MRYLIRSLPLAILSILLTFIMLTLAGCLLSPSANVFAPNLAGMVTQSAAQTAITGANFSVGAITQAYSAAVPSSVVASQAPSAGQVVEVGTLVRRHVSKGSDLTGKSTGANTVGLTSEKTQRVLQQAGYALGSVACRYSEGTAAERVLSQTPVADTVLARGCAVLCPTGVFCHAKPAVSFSTWLTHGLSRAHCRQREAGLVELRKHPSLSHSGSITNLWRSKQHRCCNTLETHTLPE